MVENFATCSLPTPKVMCSVTSLLGIAKSATNLTNGDDKQTFRKQNCKKMVKWCCENKTARRVNQCMSTLYFSAKSHKQPECNKSLGGEYAELNEVRMLIKEKDSSFNSNTSFMTINLPSSLFCDPINIRSCWEGQ